MKNDIIELLNIKDDDLLITEITTDGNRKTIWGEKRLKENYCPVCHFRMHSKGINIRTVKHPILQNGFELFFYLRQRRWKCSNDNCGFQNRDQFDFVCKHKQTTNLIPYKIIDSLRDLTLTFKQVADMYNCSDNTVRNYLMQYVHMPRLKLPKYLCIDEVYLNFDYDHKYALILMDFETKEIVDIVASRRDVDTKAYFLSISKSERNNVLYLISDMYNPYVNYTNTYFTKSVCIIDSFHVISWLNYKINIYINNVIKRYREKDKQRLDNKNYNFNLANKSISESVEVYYLRKHKWVLLKSDSNVKYSTKLFYDKKLCRYMDTYKIIDYYLSLDNIFKEIRTLKEVYVNFNNRNLGNLETAKSELNEIIATYQNSHIYFIKEFAALLSKHFNEIVNSFAIVKSKDSYGNETIRRLSNGPIESFNRKPKDLKRLARGFSNFEVTRTRILLATRSRPILLANPKSIAEINESRPKKYR